MNIDIIQKDSTILLLVTDVPGITAPLIIEGDYTKAQAASPKHYTEGYPADFHILGINVEITPTYQPEISEPEVYFLLVRAGFFDKVCEKIEEEM